MTTALSYLENCLFCRISAGSEKAWRVWEDEGHLAVLTPFPSVVGFTVVLTKAHRPSYVFDLNDGDFQGLFLAAREVGKLLDRALGVQRTALMAEGMGVDHAHLKLMPLYGIPDGTWSPMTSELKVVYQRYQGYISSHDGVRVPDADLDAIATRVRRASAP